jgi:hypothetical protein
MSDLLPEFEPNPNNIDVQWRLFEIHKASLQSIGRSQSRFVTSLLGFMAVLWAWHFMTPSVMSIELLGATLSPSGLWTIAPAVMTVLSLSLIGSMNVMGPVWKRLCDSTKRLNQKVFWTDIDSHKNVLDYLVFLRVRPEGPVEPVEPPEDPSRKYKISVFSYPIALAGSIATTLLSDYPDASLGLQTYVYACAAVQALFSFRIWYRAVCRFFGVRKEQTEV